MDKVTFCNDCGFVLQKGVEPGSCTFKHNDYFINIAQAFLTSESNGVESCLENGKIKTL